VSAESKKIVSATDIFGSEDFVPDPRQKLFDRVPWSNVGLLGGIRLRLRQIETVELTVG